MVMCLVESLVCCDIFDVYDQMNCYVNWYWYGYWSVIGECFDIGMVMWVVIDWFLQDGYLLVGSDDLCSVGNGLIMCLVLVVLCYVGIIDLQVMVVLSL